MLSPEVRDSVRKCMKLRHFEDGAAVYMMGEEGHELFQVESGKVRVCNYALNGREIQIGEVRKGDCIGELSLLDGLYRAHCAFSVGPSDLLALQKKDFERLYQENPEVPQKINELLARRLRVTYTIIEDASVLTMRDRLARTLSRLAYSIGEDGEGNCIVIRGITHEQIGRMLGSTRQAITREIKQLENEGLVRCSYGKIFIDDISSLVKRSDNMVGGDSIVPDYSAQ